MSGRWANRAGTLRPALSVFGVLLALIVTATLDASARNPANYRGLSLAEALHRLQEGGLRIVFSSDLVRPEMRVESEPRSRWPREILDELLEPHGLRSRPGQGGILLVVKGRPLGSIRGVALDERSSRGLAGVRIRVVEAGLEMVTNEEGRFRTARIPAGTYTVEARHPAYFEETLPDVSVPDGKSARIRLVLASRQIAGEHVVVRAPDSAGRRAAAAPVEPLDAEQLGQRPSFSADPFRALDRTPGVATREASAKLNVRGGGDDEVQVIFDGLELYEPFHLKDRQGLISIIDSDAVGGIDLYAGSFPAEFGGRMSGVIDIASTEPAGENRTDIGIRSDGVRIANQGLFGAGRGSWMVSARRGNLNDLREALDADPSYNPSYYDAFGKLSYALGDRSVMTFNVLGSFDELEGPDGDRVTTRDEPGTFRTRASDRYMWMTIRNLWGPRLFSESMISYGTLFQERNGSTQQVAGVDDQRNTDIAGLKQTWAFSTGRNFLTWGFDLKHVRGRYDYVATFDVPATGTAPNGVPITRSASGNDLSLYLSDQIQLRSDLRAEVGLRWSKQTYAPGGGYLSPRVNVVYDLGRRSRLRAAWGLFHQPQRINELQVEDGISTFHAPQRAEHRLIGFDRRLGSGYELRVSAYQKVMDDLSPRFENLWDPYGFFPEAQWDRTRIDASRAEARGVEIGVTSPPGRNVSWWAHYTRGSADEEIGGRRVPRAWDQRHAFAFGLGYVLRDRWSFSVAGTYRSGRPTTAIGAKTVEQPDGSVEVVPVPGPRNQERLPVFHRLDLQVSRLIPLRRMRFRLYVDVTNVYGHDNPIPGYQVTRLPDGHLDVLPVERFALPRIVTLGLNWTF